MDKKKIILKLYQSISQHLIGSQVCMAVTNGSDIIKAYHALDKIGFREYIASTAKNFDLEKAGKDFKIDIRFLPSTTPEGFYMQLARKYYPIFKGCGLWDFEISMMGFAFYKNDPVRYEEIQFDYLEPDKFVMALYGLHKSLSAKWDTVKGIDQKKSDKLYSFLYTNYPDCIYSLKSYIRKIEEYAPTLVQEPEPKPVHYAVIEGMDEFVEIQNLDENFSSQMSYKENQCRMAQFVRKIALPKIAAKEWHWSHVRSAMVKCGIFADCDTTKEGYVAISDYKFAKSIFYFLPEYIDTRNVSEKDKEHLINSIAGKCRDKYKCCDDDKHPSMYKRVSDCIEELKSYQLYFV